MIVEVVLLLIVVGLLAAHSTKRPPNFPPGLPRLPVLGSVTFLQPNFFEVIKEMHKKYKGIFSFYLGNNPVVVVTEYNLYKEAMADDAFTARASIGANDEFMRPDENGDRSGIMFADGSTWQEQRRFSLRQLRDLGFGKVGMEPLIIEEVQKCIQMLAKEAGNVTSLKLKLNVSILNALWHILTGEKLAYDDPKSKEIIQKFYIMMSRSNVVGALMLFPWLKHVMPDQLGYTNTKEANDEVADLILETYDYHMETFDGDNLRDFTDAYINEMAAQRDNTQSSFYGIKGKNNFIVNMTNMFVGGSETTSNTINYTLWYMCKHPEVQVKVHKEIDNVIGRDRMPSLEDRSKTPYLEAVTYEAQRITGLGFAGIFRVASRNTKLGGYDIPKGTRLAYGIYEIMHDPNYWSDPEDFIPERFIKDGKFHQDERFVAFGIGKRNCMGKTLALTELYLFLSALLQRFSFSFPNDHNPKQIEHEVGFILTCPNYPIILNER